MAGAGTLNRALLAAQMEMPAVDRDGVNPHFKSKFTTLGNLIATVKPVLNKNGLAFAQFPSKDSEGRPTLVTILFHESGEKLESEALLLLSKEDPQGQGSAITYMRRYALASALGISDQDDDDGNAAQATPNGGGSDDRAASERQRNYVKTLIDKAGFSEEQLTAIRAYTRTEKGQMTSKGASFLIENLKDGTAEGRTAILEAAGWSDTPGDAPEMPEPDTSDFEPAPEPEKGEDDPTGTGIDF